jgi:AraC-like DNA-binding protein
MSKRQLQRKFHDELHTTPSQYLREYRMKQAVKFLQSSASSKAAGYAVGFSSQAYFCQCFKKYYGCTPTDYLSQLPK